ncbi:leucine-rich repeat-containing protein 63 isoform X2 [Sphaerodactylus townsendi]|uniref:leucine-rich repeat-containing protein 63 isoform X2 n=1 Tax=Sphaerodactylus townsendi TaxID=933632 RepID=UPI002026B379|nr:leucine-rich repeat-containing protein 63 isoform X2 [Sphaerodactylus townsendi]
MAKPKLLRRPLPPKVETVLLMPKRKDRKATSAKHPGTHGEDKESKEIPGDAGATHVECSMTTKSHRILLSLPDSLDTTSAAMEPSCLPSDSIKRDFVIPLQPSGPPSFPLQKRRIPLRLKLPALKLRRLILPSDYVLTGCTAVVSCVSRHVEAPYPKPFISRFNYEVLCRQLMHEEMRSRQEGVNAVMLSTADLPFVPAKKTAQQALLEKLQERLLETSEATEISEEATEEEFAFLSLELKKRKKVTYSDQLLESEDLTLVSGVGCRSGLGSADEDAEMATRAELAVVSCLMHKRTGLSLKGYFLTTLPDLSVFCDFLLYLNLSFNDLHFFPTEVCDLKSLQILKLRNNPIRFIPEDIKKMTCLKTLVMSFNLLTELPPWLFMLPNLEFLDVSYNELEYISNGIRNARSLNYFIVEGNLLYVLPCGILKIPLKRLKVENNFLHPFFWKEIKQLQPQRLGDMAALCFVQNNLRKRYPGIPEDIQKQLDRNIYGLRLPYLFSACSPACYMNYIT